MRSPSRRRRGRRSRGEVLAENRGLWTSLADRDQELAEMGGELHRAQLDAERLRAENKQLRASLARTRQGPHADPEPTGRIPPTDRPTIVMPPVADPLGHVPKDWWRE